MAPAWAPGRGERECDHLNDGCESDADTTETCCLHEVRGELIRDMSWEDNCARDVDQQEADEGDDSDEPENVCDDSESLELVV